MSKTTFEGEDKDPEELTLNWVSDLSRISLLAEFIEDAVREKCDCHVCRKLRERAKAFIALSKQLPKM